MPSERITWDTEVARWRIGQKPLEEMPTAAVQALLSGLDSPALAEIAGMQGASWSEIEPVFARALAEVGPTLDDQGAQALIADAWLQRVATGEIAPRHDDYVFVYEVLDGLGGDYAWFRHALIDLDHLDSRGHYAHMERGTARIRERARQVLETSRFQRLSNAASAAEDRPLLDGE